MNPTSKIPVDILEQARITMLTDPLPVPKDDWLGRVALGLTEDGRLNFHLPRSEVFYIRSLLLSRFETAFPVLYVERLLQEEGMLTDAGNPVKRKGTVQ